MSEFCRAGVLSRGTGRSRAVSFLLGIADTLLRASRPAKALTLYPEAARQDATTPLSE
jgi:hypothetical protein